MVPITQFMEWRSANTLSDTDTASMAQPTAKAQAASGRLLP